MSAPTMTAVTPGREELLARGFKYARDWGASDTVVPMLAAFAQAEIDRLAAKPADEGVRADATYAAYLGICVLATMCKKAGLSLAEKRATELLIEMGKAFPSFAGRSALRSSPTGEPKP